MELSISSLRADSLTEDLVASLARGGHRTVTVAPEAGTERLRRAIRKEIRDEQLYAACEMIRRHGIPQPQVLLHDRPAHGDRARTWRPSPIWRPGSSERLRVLDPVGQAVRAPDPVDLLVRPQALDALPVGALRRGARAGGQARDHQARRAALLQRARAARESARGLPPGAPRPRRSPGGGLPGAGRRSRRRLAAGPARVGGGRRASTRRGSARVDERMPWDHFHVRVWKASLVREWERALAGDARAGGSRLMPPVARSARSAPPESPHLGHRPVQPALPVLHAGRGVRLAAPRGDPALRGDRRAWSTSSATSASTRSG